MRKIGLDVNITVQTILTNDGKEVYKNFTKRFREGIPHELKLDSRGTLRTTLWKLMLIFGNSFAMERDPLFIGNRIDLEIPDNKSLVYTEEKPFDEFIEVAL